MSDAAKIELAKLLEAIDASQWHDRAGEMVKRICVAPSAIARIRTVLAEPSQ